MTDKKKLEQLTGNIQQLVKLTQDIHETEIYPVSFFSEAFDLTNKIQNALHEMEVDQIALFDKKMREHQAQILSVVRPLQKTSETPLKLTSPFASGEERLASPIYLHEKMDVSLNHNIEKKTKLSDLKKAFSVNDRFRFCRELFGCDEKMMNRIISELNEKHSYEESLSHLHAEMDWDFENETVIDFLQLVERRFL